MRDISRIIIHCSYTYPSMDIGVEEIRRWHINENKWSDIGYHYVIRRNGVVEKGRDVEIPGAHVRGHNEDSIGVCLVGGKSRSPRPDCNYTPAQWSSLYKLVHELQGEFPGATVHGHYEFTGAKTCPTFDVSAWAEGL